MFAAVARNDAECCVAPIENSLAGSIHRNYDLVLESELTIVGETNLRIVHHLIAAPDADLAGLRRDARGLRAAGKKLDMGKSCIRFKRLEDLSLEVIGKPVARVPVKDFVAQHESAMTARGRKR